MLVELYRRFAGDYPKFFKMDTLSRLGFIAAEILLKEPIPSDRASRQRIANSQKPTAIILANRSASIKNDTDYMATISDGKYYPSPALFVYTLPNIVTGEIAIRHQMQGETSFYILDKPEDLEPILLSTFHTASADRKNIQPSTSALAGWCECSDANTFYAKIQIIWNN